MVMSLNGRQVRTIGSFGDGPGEYQQVRDLLVDDDGFWILDARSRLMQYGFEGGMRQLWKLPFTALKLLGRSGQIFFLVCRSVSEVGQFENEVIRWQEGKEPVSLFKMPLVVMRTKAFSLDGREIAGGGLVTLSAPAFAFLETGWRPRPAASYSIRFLTWKDGKRIPGSLRPPSLNLATQYLVALIKNSELMPSAIYSACRTGWLLSATILRRGSRGLIASGLMVSFVPPG